MNGLDGKDSGVSLKAEDLTGHVTSKKNTGYHFFIYQYITFNWFIELFQILE